MSWVMIGGNVYNFVEQHERDIFWRIGVKCMYVYGGYEQLYVLL